jgi:hypothetical protein
VKVARRPTPVDDGDDPAAWPISAAGKRLLCTDCGAIRKLRAKFAAEDRVRQLAETTDASVAEQPTATKTLLSGRPRVVGYRKGTAQCPSCGDTVPFLDWDDDTPPEARPATVRRLRRQFPDLPAGEFGHSPMERAALLRGGWANWCSSCGALLGTALHDV